MMMDARESNLSQGDNASQKALDLDPDLAEAPIARGRAVSRRRQFDKAEQGIGTQIRRDTKLF